MATAGKRAPTLYSVIAFKAIKGIVFLLLALSFVSLTDNNLPEDFRHVLHSLKVDPESRFWAHIEEQLKTITPTNLWWMASGTSLYAILSLAEATGLAMRKAWGGWLAIGEGAFFIPIEIYELSRRYRPELAAILVINIVIVVYLWFSRDRLFSHGGGAAASASPKKPKKKD